MEMIHEYKSIEPWYEPTDRMREDKDFICEMSRTDHGFLCGMIKKIMPRRILEVGVAEGGTTAVIAKSMEMLELPCEMYSVDLDEKLWCNKEYETGYIFKALQKADNVKHQFLFGRTIAGQIENCMRGGKADLVILDTTHRVPGEILDFLCVLPFLSENGVVILHDINLNYKKAVSRNREQIKATNLCLATKIVYLTAVAEKYCNFELVQNCNIGALKINDNTCRHAEDLFMALSLTWSYQLNEEMISEYRKLLQKYYPVQCMELFDICVKMNHEMYANICRVKNREVYSLPSDKIYAGSRIILYGAGHVGRTMWASLQSEKNIEIVGVVDSNYEKYQDTDTDGIKVETPEAIRNKEFDYIMVAVEREQVFEEIAAYIESNHYAKENQIIRPVRLI